MKRFVLGATLAAALLALAPAAAAEDITELVPGTAVLLSQSDGGGGSGGNTKSTSSSTNIFSPAAHADYKRFGGEPTVVVDRYPFLPGAFDCPATATAPCPPKDITYDSAPQGVPSYSSFFKSTDLAQTFRVPAHTPSTSKPIGSGVGGGDSHFAIGELSHKVYFVDLSLACVTMNVSADLGENWISDNAACGIAPLDDRQWVEADERLNTATGGNVYISTINILDLAFPTLAVFRSTMGAAPGSFTASPCNAATFAVGAGGLVPGPDATPTPCADPADPYLWVAGPVVADREGTATRPPTHHIYVPFIRRVSTGGLGLDVSAWQIYIAKSIDGGTSWTRHKVADLPAAANPANIFPQLTIDRGGNLYYTWSQDTPAEGDPDEMAEQDVFYTFSTGGGLAGTWAPPINLTKENGDSAIFPWLVAGDPGRVDIVAYKANTGLNSNIAFADANGEECEEGTEGCNPNPSVWNVYFGQSLNATNTGANFKLVQVSAQPNHVGQICTGGLGCEGDRDLLDFFTVDKDSRGAAVIAYSDDHVRRNTDTRDRVTRQIAGNSLFKDKNINLQSSWPIRDHAVSDPAGDVFSGAGMARNSCPGMDVLGLKVARNDDLITFELTLNSPPSAAAAIACSADGTATGGIWGAEFGAATVESATPDKFNQFWIAYRDNPPEAPQVQAGPVDDLNLTIQSMEFRQTDVGDPPTPGGTCFTLTPPTPCTLVVSEKASDLGIKPGDGLYSVTGLSLYFFGTENKPPLLRIEGGNSEQADATAPLHFLGSGTPPK